MRPNRRAGAMNLILFDNDELSRPLKHDDPRARHILTVLRARSGQSFDCGIVDGPIGKGTIRAKTADGITLDFNWGETPRPLAQFWLLCGLSRPQTVRKILGEAPTMGATRLAFFPAERGERSYAQSQLWRSGEIRRHLIAAAQQAFCTRLAKVALHATLQETLGQFEEAITRLAFDNYALTSATESPGFDSTPVVLAIGPERGWSDQEREELRLAGYSLVNLGRRVLRTETACVAALAVAKTKLGLW